MRFKHRPLILLKIQWKMLEICFLDHKAGDVIKGIQTPAIQKAYELVRFKSLPPQIKIQYETEEFGFHRYSQHTQEKIEEDKF